MKTFQVFLEDTNQAQQRQKVAKEKQQIIQQKYNKKRESIRNKNIEKIIAKRNAQKERENIENEIEKDVTPEIEKRIARELTPEIEKRITKKITPQTEKGIFGDTKKTKK